MYKLLVIVLLFASCKSDKENCEVSLAVSELSAISSIQKVDRIKVGRFLSGSRYGNYIFIEGQVELSNELDAENFLKVDDGILPVRSLIRPSSDGADFGSVILNLIGRDFTYYKNSDSLTEIYISGNMSRILFLQHALE